MDGQRNPFCWPSSSATLPPMPRLVTEFRRLADQTHALCTNLSQSDPMRQRLVEISDKLHTLARHLGEILDRFDMPLER